jgi:hypothetical protein
MKKRKIRETISWAILLPSGLIIGLFIWAIGIAGDRFCQIEIQNIQNEGLVIKTFTYRQYGKKLTIDSIQLKPNEKIIIGHCIGCSTISTKDIDFIAIGILECNKVYKILKGQELIDYLATKDKVDCATYQIE